MSRIYLVRHAVHGLVDKALAGRMAGVQLSAEGRAQAARLADHFAHVPVTRILSSPLERCRETAQSIADALGFSVGIEPALLEIDCGIWTGQDFETLSHDPHWHIWNTERAHSRIPGGESASDVQSRAMAFIESVSGADQGPVLLVTHSDVIKTIVLTLIGASLDRYGHVAVDPASVTTLDLWPGGGKVVRLNEEARA